jgi:hypothetical protein
VTQEERDPEDLGGEYGFRAGICTEWDWDAARGEMCLGSAYVVELPHQCDAWSITRAGNREQAIADMECFIAEAQTALRKIKESP